MSANRSATSALPGLLLALLLAGCGDPVLPRDIVLTLEASEPAAVEINGESVGDAPISFTLPALRERFQAEFVEPTSSFEQMEQAQLDFLLMDVGKSRVGSGEAASGSHDFHTRTMTDLDQGTTTLLMRYEAKGFGSGETIAGGVRVAVIAKDGTRLEPMGSGGMNSSHVWSFSR